MIFSEVISILQKILIRHCGPDPGKGPRNTRVGFILALYGPLEVHMTESGEAILRTRRRKKIRQDMKRYILPSVLLFPSQGTTRKVQIITDTEKM